MPPAAPDILARIVARKREELGNSTVPGAELRSIAEAREDFRDFAAALRSRSPAIISEIKKASPSKGVLIEDFHPAELARKYQQGGAAALSVLTDKDFFQGSLQDLQTARAACALPVIRKDFTISDYQIYEAAAAGADAILLIAAILDEAQLRDFRELAECCGMASLVEAHDAREVETAVRSGAEIIGINNRDLKSFKVDLNQSIELCKKIPFNKIKISESGIDDVKTIDFLKQNGFSGFLMGEKFMKEKNPGLAFADFVKELRDVENKIDV